MVEKYYDMCRDDYNNSYITGYTDLMKLDSSGNLLWTKNYHSDDCLTIYTLYAILTLSDGSPVMSANGWVRRLTSDGD